MTCIWKCIKNSAIFSLVIFIWLFVGLSNVQAQEKAKILKIASTTEDIVTFQISTPISEYKLGENIDVDYLVKNSSKRTVYLVIPKQPKLSALKDSEIIKVHSPARYPNEHLDEYNFKVVKILPKRDYQGRLELDGSKIQANKDYASESWQLQIGFSYLFDVSNLIGCGETDYHLPCLTELYNKSKSLSVGNIIITIKKR